MIFWRKAVHDLPSEALDHIFADVATANSRNGVSLT